MPCASGRPRFVGGLMYRGWYRARLSSRRVKRVPSYYNSPYTRIHVIVWFLLGWVDGKWI